MANPARPLDTNIEIVTPENIAFQYRVAGPFRRIFAYLIDFVLRAVVTGIVFLGLIMFFGLAQMPGVGFGIFLVFSFLLWSFYGAAFEAYWNGQTPGKRIMRLRVLSIDGQPIGGMQAVLRNVLRVVDMQPMFCCQVGLVAAACNRRFQRLGDLAAGTMVVVEERSWLHGMIWTNDEEVLRVAGLIPPNFRADRTMARALAAYVPRRNAFSWQRRLEIATYLGAPLRERLGLPSDTDPDVLLCAAYHRTFITDRDESYTCDGTAKPGDSPFASGPEHDRSWRKRWANPRKPWRVGG